MSNEALRMTKDLVEAFTDVTGDAPADGDPLVVVASYIDALAKEFGLSESLKFDIDPIERTQLDPHLMSVVTHYLSGDRQGIDADGARAHVYGSACHVADSPGARNVLNRSQPLTQNAVLYLAQTYWNIEATSDRPRLPIKPEEDRDIPTPGTRADFATMKWTKRVNQKGVYKSSGQSFRRQGARLSVLIAQSLLERSTPLPADRTAAVSIERRDDVDAPIEVTVKDLALQAYFDGEFDDALDLSTSYVHMMARRAQVDLDLETELAEALALRGWFAMRPDPHSLTGDFVLGNETLDDLEKAANSLETLADLDSQNVDLLNDLFLVRVQQTLAFASGQDFEAAVASALQAVALSERIAEISPHHAERRRYGAVAYVRLAQELEHAGRPDDAVSAWERAITALQTTGAPHSDETVVRGSDGSLVPTFMEDGYPTIVSWTQSLISALSAAARHSEALQLAEKTVRDAAALKPSEPSRAVQLSYSYATLSDALAAAGQPHEATKARANAIDALSAQPALDLSSRSTLLMFLHQLSTALMDLGEREDGLDAAERLLAVCAPLIELELENITDVSLVLLAIALPGACERLQEAGRLAPATSAIDGAEMVCRELIRRRPNDPKSTIALLDVASALAACGLHSRAAEFVGELIMELPKTGFDSPSTPFPFRDASLALIELPHLYRKLYVDAGPLDATRLASAERLLRWAEGLLRHSLLTADRPMVQWERAGVQAYALVVIDLYVLLKEHGRDDEATALGEGVARLLESLPDHGDGDREDLN